jgi:hypothetical protein
VDELTGGLASMYEILLSDAGVGRSMRLAGLSADDAARRLRNGSWDPFTAELLDEEFDHSTEVLHELAETARRVQSAQ